MYETTEQILASLEQCYRNGEITNFLASFSDKSMDLVRKGEYKGRKFYELYPQLVIYEADGNHSYNAKIVYQGEFIVNGKPITVWAEDSIKVSVVRENEMFGIKDEYMTVEFAKNSEFMTVAKKKTFLQMAERYNSMIVREIK